MLRFTPVERYPIHWGKVSAGGATGWTITTNTPPGTGALSIDMSTGIAWAQQHGGTWLQVK